MKHNISAIVMVAAALLSASCSKFLDERPQTDVYEEMAVNSEAALEANMIAIYNGLSYICSSQYTWYAQVASRLTEYISKRNTEDYLQLREFTFYSTSTQNQTIYSRMYAAINRCNTLIARLPESPVDPAYKKEIEAEARFMRAFFYFGMVRFWGDLPLITAPCETEKDAYVKRSPYYRIYQQIIEDLDFAYDNMRTKERQDQLNLGRGRSYNMAAKALAADVYMQMACIMENPSEQFYDTSKPGRLPDFSACGVFSAEEAWTKSLDAARTVINSGVYALEPDFRHLFRWDKKNYPEDYLTKERIVTLQVSPTSGISTSVNVMLWDNPQGTLSFFTHNGSAGRTRASRFLFDKWCAAHGGIKDTRSNIEIYVGTPDPRFDASFRHTEVWGVDADLNSETSGQLVRTEVYPSESKVKGSASSDPYIFKFFSPTYNVDSGDAHYYLLRYAGTLLTAAEAAAALSGGPGDAYWTEALGYVNQLFARARASVNEGDPQASEPQDWTAASFSTKKELIDAIIWERRFELCFEGAEWYDTHRRGAKWLSDNIAKAQNEWYKEDRNQKLFTDFNNGIEYIEDVQILRKSLLFAYPEYELRYNSALSAADQNDFYIQ